MSKKYHDNKEAYKEDSQVFFDFIFYLNVTLTVGYLCILSSMNKFLFKTNEGWDALAIYISIIFFSSLIQFFHQKLFIENKQSLSFVILSIGLLVKIGLTPLLTYYYSILGSSLSTLLPLILVLLLYGYHSDIDYHALTNVRYAISLFIMTFSVILLQFVLPKQTRIDNFCSLIVATSCGLGLFLYSAKKLEAFDQKLWSYLPFNKEK
ncbi:oligosaccharide flippase family protein [Streptococcus didelphis]|uniref:polysaccharide biosynthesis C-terminal domain-containing protein n=1 Tax=Streptococcus didelphis TaxID=102886 RepID=UPI0027D2EAB6|nr:polysaccharide biosynthesis C-terminal domain-containing protein [Streptococcus didelphis]WMB29905.1 oligosaccharide flippase family protein [Streptococcus didelphis]